MELNNEVSNKTLLNSPIPKNEDASNVVPIEQQPLTVDYIFENLIFHETIISVVSLYSEETIQYNPTNQLLKYYKLNENIQENIIKTLQQMGTSIGKKLSLDFNNNSTMTHLQIIKHICKEVYHKIFGRQIDSLKTNHQGIFYLLDKQLLANSSIDFDKSLENYNPSESQKQIKCLELYPNFVAAVLGGYLDRSVTFTMENRVITYIIKY
ncbi:hypothetical protein QEN19_004283 [Hanseniaspora menglaensis]